jgi:DNA-binding HxlR family transcriptional regulator
VRLTVLTRERRRRHAGAPPRLLVDEGTRAIVRALADGPRRPSELETLRGIVRSTMYARLGELTAHGIVASDRLTEFPLRVAYRLNDAARAMLAHELLIERQERRILARTGPGVDAALDSLLRLLAPVSRPATDRGGFCVLVEREPSGRTHAVPLLVRDRRIAVSELASAVDPRVRFNGASRVWEDALLAGGTRGLRIVGDTVLGGAVMGAFGAALNA